MTIIARFFCIEHDMAMLQLNTTTHMTVIINLMTVHMHSMFGRNRERWDKQLRHASSGYHHRTQQNIEYTESRIQRQ